MNITARNYAAQAVNGLLKFSKKISNELYTASHSVKVFAEYIEKSVHFALPDGGLIFNDGFKGIHNKKIRLPFPMITLEWYENNDPAPNGTQKVKKRLLLAIEYEGTDGEIKISVLSCFQFENGVWEPGIVGYIFDSAWDINRPVDAKAGCQYEVFSLPGLEHLFNENLPPIGNAPILLEFLEALSCSNIDHSPIEKIDPRKNARRIKDGKLPFYETHILTIQAGKSTNRNHYGGTHASPRQHLRRGHIRRVGDKNIWVNSCVVGKADIGVIEKQYRVISKQA